MYNSNKETFTKIYKNSSDSCSTDEHNCCTPAPKSKHECPKCSKKAKEVLEKTVKNLVNMDLDYYSGFHYCKTPSCEIIYFKENKLLTQKDLKVIVGLKDNATPATMCYCFNWTKEKIKTELQETNETTALEDIKDKMENLGCSCEILNPSGGCCLGDTKKAVKEIKLELKQ